MAEESSGGLKFSTARSDKELETAHLPRKRLVRKLLNARQELDDALLIAKEVDNETTLVIEELRTKIKYEILKTCAVEEG